MFGFLYPMHGLFIPTLFLTLLLMSSRYPFHFIRYTYYQQAIVVCLTKHAVIVLHVYMSVCVLIMVTERTHTTHPFTVWIVVVDLSTPLPQTPLQLVWWWFTLSSTLHCPTLCRCRVSDLWGQLFIIVVLFIVIDRVGGRECLVKMSWRR